MFKELIDNLKNKRQKLVATSNTFLDTTENDDNVEIIIDEFKNFFRMQISDYVTIQTYCNKTDEEDIYDMCKKISMSILWNSGQQRVNKGVFYVLSMGNVVYNFWTDGKEIMVDERVKQEDETWEKILRFNLMTNDYAFTFFKHDRLGSTFYNMYYYTEGMDMGLLAFTKDEAYEEIKPFFDRILSIENVLDIIDVDKINKIVLSDLRPEGVKKELKGKEEIKC